MRFRRTLRLLVMVMFIRSWIADGQDRRVPSRKQHDAGAQASKDLKERYAYNKYANETVVLGIVDRLLSRYDNRLRPNLGGAPVPVGISLHITSIKDISEESLDYTVSMYIHLTWKDSRLAYHETDLNLTLSHTMLKKLWYPDCHIVNSRDNFMYMEPLENRMIRLQPDGTMQYGMKLTATVPCDIDLKNYPLDKQTCKLGVESYSYSSEDVTFYWNGNEKAVQISEDLIIPQFTFLGRKLEHKESSFYTGSYMSLVLTFWMQRKLSGYILHIYWPLILLTITSWITFWMSCKCSTSRVTLGLSSTLILNSLSTFVRESLPQMTCIKAIDVYMAVCFFMVVLSVIEYAFINYVYYNRRNIRGHNRRRRRIQRIMARYRFEEVFFLVFFLN
ncbi:gamma-aminobutyric acid receptor subunit theta [Sorex araneus]|uniref:gamma-aminobutyric acid receptor subunit theta n=1 Tax=Sorex araneus TaxID=42254 RepID=UPI002433E148|nr:gamma-aminobutyric acid receptor subunit theta [Sorex araneus]